MSFSLAYLLKENKGGVYRTFTDAIGNRYHELKTSNGNYIGGSKDKMIKVTWLRTGGLRINK